MYPVRRKNILSNVVGEIYTLQDLKVSASLLKKDFFPKTVYFQMLKLLRF